MPIAPSEAPDRAIIAAMEFHNGVREGLDAHNVEEIDNEIRVEWYDGSGDEWEPTTLRNERGINELGKNEPDFTYTQALPREYERIAEERDL